VEFPASEHIACVILRQSYHPSRRQRGGRLGMSLGLQVDNLVSLYGLEPWLLGVEQGIVPLRCGTVEIAKTGSGVLSNSWGLGIERGSAHGPSLD
jgi:hypothetical protein